MSRCDERTLRQQSQQCATSYAADAAITARKGARAAVTRMCYVIRCARCCHCKERCTGSSHKNVLRYTLRTLLSLQGKVHGQQSQQCATLYVAHAAVIARKGARAAVTRTCYVIRCAHILHSKERCMGSSHCEEAPHFFPRKGVETAAIMRKGTRATGVARRGTNQ